VKQQQQQQHHHQLVSGFRVRYNGVDEFCRVRHSPPVRIRQHLDGIGCWFVFDVSTSHTCSRQIVEFSISFDVEDVGDGVVDQVIVDVVVGVVVVVVGVVVVVVC